MNGMNSCLYDGYVYHGRLRPARHVFCHRFFYFYLDLDELPWLDQRLKLFSYNKPNLYSFYERDHVLSGEKTLKQGIQTYLMKHGVDLSGGRIHLLTFGRMCGYVFNPVSFFFCYDRSGQPICVIAEVGNTFGEMKMFRLKRTFNHRQPFEGREKKYFYISPYTDLDNDLWFRVFLPDERLNVMVQTQDASGTVVVATLQGQRRPLRDGELLRCSVRIPFVTLKAIGLIHWHALLLWLKGVPYRRKEEEPEKQKGVLHAGR